MNDEIQERDHQWCGITRSSYWPISNTQTWDHCRTAGDEIWKIEWMNERKKWLRTNSFAKLIAMLNMLNDLSKQSIFGLTNMELWYLERSIKIKMVTINCGVVGWQAYDLGLWHYNVQEYKKNMAQMRDRDLSLGSFL